MAEMKVQYDEKALERLRHKYHVRRLDLFGSQAKGTAAESDVDLLVECSEATTWSWYLRVA